MGDSDPRKEIEILVGSPATFIFDGKMVRAMREPCVYVWLRDQEVLYVGKGSSGIKRPLSSSHHRLRSDAIFDTDELLIFRCPPGTEFAIEQGLIAKLKPKLNGTNSPLDGERLVRDAMRVERPVGNILIELERLRSQVVTRKEEESRARQEHKALSRENTELKRALESAHSIESAEDRAILAATVQLGEYGPVMIVDELDEQHNGMIGFYDDHEPAEGAYEELQDHCRECRRCDAANAKEYAENEEFCTIGQFIMAEQAIVEFEDLTYVFVDFENLRHIPQHRAPEWVRGEWVDWVAKREQRGGGGADDGRETLDTV